MCGMVGQKETMESERSISVQFSAGSGAKYEICLVKTVGCQVPGKWGRVNVQVIFLEYC